MSDNLNQGTAIPGEGAPPPPVESFERAAPVVEQQHHEPAADAGDVESRARAQGWVPKEEFRGPPEKWRDAGEFVRHGEENLPVLRERLRAMERTVNDLRQGQTQHQDTVQRLAKMSEVALQRQREQIVASYEAAMRDAATVGDVARYDQLRQDQVQAVQNHDRRVYEAGQNPQHQPGYQQPGQQQALPPAPPEFEAWANRNQWFRSNTTLQNALLIEAKDIESQYPGMQPMEVVLQAEKAVRRRYADKFGPPAAQSRQPSAVEGGSRFAGGGSRQRSAADLPADARAQGERFIRDGLFKNLNDYARDYFAQEGV